MPNERCPCGCAYPDHFAATAASESVRPGEELPFLEDIHGERVFVDDLVWSLNVWAEGENQEAVSRGKAEKLPVLCKLVRQHGHWYVEPMSSGLGGTGCPPDVARGRFGIYKAYPESLLAGRSQSDARDLSTEAKTTSSKPESNQNQKGQPMLMTMPTPPPEPIPGGGPQDGYQFAFNENYYKTRRKELQPFFYGRPGAEAGTELTQDERVALANSLYHADPRVPFDEQIDFEGEDSYETMYQRKVVFGYDRVPYGQGTDGPVVPVDDSDFKGPVVPGYLPVSVDIADFKAS